MSNFKAPLYHMYMNQSKPQGAYLELDLRDSHPMFQPDWNGEIGNAVPFAVWPLTITGRCAKIDRKGVEDARM